MKKKVLVVAVHPDDETLGAGGTLFSHLERGDEIYWCVVTEMNETQGFSKKQINLRRSQIKHIKDLYHFKKSFFLGFPTMKLDEVSFTTMIGKISVIIQEIKPQIIYLPFKYDIHSDHRKSFEAFYSCTKSFRYPFIQEILMMEILSETDFAPSLPSETFSPNVYVDISKYVKQKMKALQIFKEELGLFPFPRSLENVEALSKLRGAQMGKKAAEAFMLLKSYR